MLRSWLVSLLSLSGLGLMAQTELGGGLTFGTGADEIGLHLKGHLPLSPRFDLSPGFNLFVFEANGPRERYFWEINGDVHALFDATPRLVVYPLAGLSLGVRQTRAPHEPDLNQLRPGLNLGGGASYYLTPALAANGELKFVVGPFSQAVLTLGVLYTL